MLDIEPYLVEMIGALEKMRVPISSRQGLSLANSIISGTSYEKNVMAWKEKHCFWRKNSFVRKMILGRVHEMQWAPCKGKERSEV